MSFLQLLIVGVCLLASLLYVVARWRDASGAAVLSKTVASVCFVVLAILSGAQATAYGRAILAGLILSLFGDLFLLSRRNEFLLAGIVSFFAAHIAFAAAFVIAGLEVYSLILGSVLTAVFGLAVWRWIRQFTTGVYRIAVFIYLCAIGVMTSMAISAGYANQMWTLVIGAAAFAVSDVSVARDRFVRSEISNKAWGIPLYYFAQLLLAASILSINAAM